MRIAIGSDHAGFEAKEAVRHRLSQLGHEVVDEGTSSADATDYPDYAERVAHAVASGKAERGVLICGTGIGMSITANKVKGIRAAVCHNVMTAEASRRHNNANVLCLGSRVLTLPVIENLLEVWLTTDFEGGRHARRVEKIAQVEERGGSFSDQ